jgi:two-component system, chemotaxis family, sensor kinase CheA
MAISTESLQRELRAVFAHEACDSLARVELLIERQQRAPADASLLDALFREFHTMKVGAAAAGLPQAAGELHAAESLLEAARAGEARLGAQAALASLRQVVECVRRAVGAPLEVPSERLALATIWPALSYAVALAAAMEHKFVALQNSGGEVVVERAVGDALRAALLHLVRNAVAHGIELPEARHAVGKLRVGCVAVHAERSPEGLVVTVADDGAGVDVAAVTAAARRRGLLAADAAPPLPDLVRVLFQPGFTTRTEATELAGRGVGLDAVAEALRGLGGTIEIESLPGAGCTAHLTVPA